MNSFGSLHFLNTKDLNCTPRSSTRLLSDGTRPSVAACPSVAAQLCSDAPAAENAERAELLRAPRRAHGEPQGSPTYLLPLGSHQRHAPDDGPPTPAGQARGSVCTARGTAPPPPDTGPLAGRAASAPPVRPFRGSCAPPAAARTPRRRSSLPDNRSAPGWTPTSRRASRMKRQGRDAVLRLWRPPRPAPRARVPRCRGAARPPQPRRPGLRRPPGAVPFLTRPGAHGDRGARLRSARAARGVPEAFISPQSDRLLVK